MNFRKYILLSKLHGICDGKQHNKLLHPIKSLHGFGFSDTFEDDKSIKSFLKVFSI